MSSENMDRATPPLLPPDSPGSSVSSTLQEEYTELLKHVVISSLTEGQVDSGLETVNLTENKQSSSTPTSQTEVNQSELTPRGQIEEKVSTPRSPIVASPRQSEKDNISNQASFHSNCTEDGNEATQNLMVLMEPSVTNLGEKLDGWLGDLRTNILSEVSSVSLLVLQNQKDQHEKEMKDLVSDKQRLEREINRLSELVATCEQSMSRKDTLLDNLTQGLAKQRERTKAAQCFFNWRVELLDSSREKFCEKIAVLHHEKQLVQRVLKGWFGQVQTRWRTRVERRCQEQAQGVCRQLSQDYESKIASLNNTVSELQSKVHSLQTEREQYAESVKKAFMRGVCALNMEAMSAFTNEDHGAAGTAEVASSLEDVSNDTFFQDATSPNFKADKLLSGNMNVNYPSKESENMKTLILSDLENSKPLSRSNSPMSRGRVKKEKQKTRISAPGSLHGQVLAPPMASIVVERHQPVTKQTVGKATASRYPKPKHSVSESRQVSTSAVRYHPSTSASQTFKPLAGQTISHRAFKVVD